ncbi:hypothetical protein AYO20_07208 [Fonsecaea nubica]|uniref:D-xylose 1-dehydrogenase (NADP(+), D-xylono-1,5-lactone-forming) n=1 Tax=Fonsecaea nubica TaxID=856822 RepID=A0A178CWE7_9EURO|nr:hypothetical protein AYO20_07208 [Fonsecaea nubica]OAL33522.1 hypothetical protein AYO20_07208 [Fonsecaea nubica]
MNSSGNSSTPQIRWGIIGNALFEGLLSISGEGYREVYCDPDVDVAYIGTIHTFHEENCLDAIAAGKNVVCEKPFTINSKEAREVIEAAKARNVFLMEAMWTRFTPLVHSLRKKLFEEKVIGDIQRTFCDFGLDMNISSLGPESRLKNPNLGAGCLLDIRIYSLTWGLLTLDPKLGDQRETPIVVSIQSLSDRVDHSTSILLKYYPSGRHGILTATTLAKSGREFCRIEGSQGHVIVEGRVASAPESFTVSPKNTTSSAVGDAKAERAQNDHQRYTFEKLGRGFYWEADAVAIDIAAGRTQSQVMPLSETLKTHEIMDEVRRQGGVQYPQDQ